MPDFATPLWTALALTLRLAAVSTLLLLLIGLPVAHALAFRRGPLARLTEALIALPIVLPPTVLGFYLLLALSPDSPLGAAWQALFGFTLPFSFAGLVLGSVIYSFPFAVQPFLAGFRGVDQRLLEAAATLGDGPLRRFFRVLLPLSLPSVGVGVVLAFAHTLGEFGVVLMIGGNIPGVTQVASIALYDEVQQLNYAAAHQYALLLLGISFLILLLMTTLQGRRR